MWRRSELQLQLLRGRLVLELWRRQVTGLVSLGAVKLASFSLSPHNITKVVGTSRHLDNGVGIYIDVSEMDTGIERNEAPVDWTTAPMGKGNKLY